MTDEKHVNLVMCIKLKFFADGTFSVNNNRPDIKIAEVINLLQIVLKEMNKNGDKPGLLETWDEETGLH